MSYGDATWRDWVRTEDEAKPIVKRAVEAGINFFDTADMYSLGQSEEITGRLLKEFTRRDETVIATKVFFNMSDKPNRGGLGRKHIYESVFDSLKKRDKVRIIFGKWVTLDHADLVQKYFLITEIVSKGGTKGEKEGVTKGGREGRRG